MVPAALLAERGDEAGGFVLKVLFPWMIVARERLTECFSRLFVVCPHPDHLHYVLGFEYLIDQPMMDVDSAGICAG